MMSLCKDYLKDRSTGRAGLNGYSAVMYAHDFMNQGQPKAYSAKLAASGLSTRKNGSNMRSFNSAGIPLPVSSTDRQMFFPSGMRLR